MLLEYGMNDQVRREGAIVFLGGRVTYVTLTTGLTTYLQRSRAIQPPPLVPRHQRRVAHAPIIGGKWQGSLGYMSV